MNLIKYLWQKIDDKTVMPGGLRHPKVTFDLNVKFRRCCWLSTLQGINRFSGERSEPKPSGYIGRPLST